MNAISTLKEVEALTPQQALFVEALIKGASNEDAMKAAGYSDKDHASRLLGSLRVQAAIRAACDAELAGPVRVAAMLKLKELVTMPGIPSATAFNAAKLIIERGDDGEQGSTKPLTEMTIAELEALIERKSGELRDVTPSNGA